MAEAKSTTKKRTVRKKAAPKDPYQALYEERAKKSGLSVEDEKENSEFERSQ